MKIETIIKDCSEESIKTAFEKLSEASGEFEQNRDAYLGESSIRSIQRQLRKFSGYSFTFVHFHTNQCDIEFTIKMQSEI